MGARTGYKQGTFSWVDLATLNVDRAKTFYSGLFGWEFVDMPTDMGPYCMAQLNGKSITALFEMGPDMKKQNLPPFWQSYITVDNIEQMTEKAKSCGAQVMAGPFDVMTAGRMSVLTDPVGATINLWEAKEHFGAEIVNDPNTFCWNELNTDKPSEAKTFWQKFMGWSYETDENNYHMIKNGENMNGGIFDTTPIEHEVPPHWNTYFTVENISNSCAKVKDLGGKIMVEPTEISVGTFSVINDDQGGYLTLIQLNQIDP